MLASCARPTPVVTPPNTEDTEPVEVTQAPELLLEEANRRFAQANADEAATVLRLAGQACAGGSRDACVAEAVLRRNGIGTPQDLSQAVRILKTGCDAGHAASCTELGVHYDRPWGVPWDEDEARRLYRLGDAGGDLEAKMLLAALEYGDYHEGEALSLANAACADGHARACLFAYERQLHRDDTEAQGERLSRAAQGLEPECRSGEIRTAARSCLMLSRNGDFLACTDRPECEVLQAWQESQPAMSDDQRERTWAEAACALGSVDGCGALGLATDETPEGLALLERACEHDHHSSCVWLGWLFFHGHVGPTPDRPRSIGLYARACERGSDVDACRMWETYCGEDTVPCPLAVPDSGEPRSEICGTAQECWERASDARLTGDAVGGAALYGQACALALAPACFRLGDMHTTGELGPPDELEAARYYGLACDRDHARGCFAAGAHLLDAGRTTEACPRLHRACTLDESMEACRLVKQRCPTAHGQPPTP